jgi:hypothetical protein
MWHDVGQLSRHVTVLLRSKKKEFAPNNKTVTSTNYQNVLLSTIQNNKRNKNKKT